MVSENKSLIKGTAFNPSRIVFVSFLFIILAGSLLLYLPFSAVKPISYIDALYTSTSAVCVTGLTVKDTSLDFTLTGQLIILCLIQIGGLGLMMFSLMFLSLFSKKLSIRDSVLAGEITGQSKFNYVKDIVKYVILFTIGAETIGFLLLFSKFITYYPFKYAAYISVFHSVSAFCNAGFSLFSNNLADFKSDLWINYTVMALIITGGVGFVAVFEMQNYFTKRKKSKKKILISLHTKITLLTTGILVFTGTVLIFFFEYNGQLKQFNTIYEKITASTFHSVTCRTAGFNTLNIADLSHSGLLLSIVLMFIGGSPCSTAGGIKTTTFAVLIMTLATMIKDKENVEIFKKQIPKHLINKTLAVVTIYFLIVIISTALVLNIEYKSLGNDMFVKVFFETVSAIGTVGLSMDVTPKLCDVSKIIYICVMFAGRIGLLSFLIAFVPKEKKILYKLPEEKVLIG
ncbi:MAG TPA: TrkH family potassium uptake protein [bacterium]|nr:TrkH family potassium uptake protein [bacterium]